MSDTFDGLDPADIEMLREAAAGECIHLTEELASAIGKALVAKEDAVLSQLQNMTKEQAETVRHLRMDKELSWRALAHECHTLGFGEWEPVWLQSAGRALCWKASEVLGIEVD